MAKLDFYEAYVQVGKMNDTHYEIKLRVLFEAGDDEQSVILQTTDKLQVEALRIATAEYVDQIDDKL